MDEDDVPDIEIAPLLSPIQDMEVVPGSGEEDMDVAAVPRTPPDPNPADRTASLSSEANVSSDSGLSTNSAAFYSPDRSGRIPQRLDFNVATSTASGSRRRSIPSATQSRPPAEYTQMHPLGPDPRPLGFEDVRPLGPNDQNPTLSPLSPGPRGFRMSEPLVRRPVQADSASTSGAMGPPSRPARRRSPQSPGRLLIIPVTSGRSPLQAGEAPASEKGPGSPDSPSSKSLHVQIPLEAEDTHPGSPDSPSSTRKSGEPREDTTMGPPRRPPIRSRSLSPKNRPHTYLRPPRSPPALQPSSPERESEGGIGQGLVNIADLCSPEAKWTFVGLTPHISVHRLPNVPPSSHSRDDVRPLADIIPGTSEEVRPPRSFSAGRIPRRPSTTDSDRITSSCNTSPPSRRSLGSPRFPDCRDSPQDLRVQTPPKGRQDRTPPKGGSNENAGPQGSWDRQDRTPPQEGSNQNAGAAWRQPQGSLGRQDRTPSKEGSSRRSPQGSQGRQDRIPSNKGSDQNACTSPGSQHRPTDYQRLLPELTELLSQTPSLSHLDSTLPILTALKGISKIQASLLILARDVVRNNIRQREEANEKYWKARFYNPESLEAEEAINLRRLESANRQLRADYDERLQFVDDLKARIASEAVVQGPKLTKSIGTQTGTQSIGKQFASGFAPPLPVSHELQPTIYGPSTSQSPKKRTADQSMGTSEYVVPKSDSDSNSPPEITPPEAKRHKRSTDSDSSSPKPPSPENS